MVVGNKYLLILVDGTALDAADADTADKFVIVDRRHQYLQRAVRLALGRVDIADDRLEQRHQILAGIVGAVGRRTLPGRAENGGRVELLLGGVEVEQELEHLVHDLVHACVGPVDLIDDHDDLVAQLQRLLQHEARLRHRALGGVDQQQDAVDHLENTLNLAGEVGVARGIDDIDLVIFIMNGGVLGQNRDAALALEIARVHHAVGHDLVFAVHTALLQHFIDQRRLTVVDMRDDRNVSDLVLRHMLRPFLLMRNLTKKYSSTVISQLQDF